MTQQTNPPPDVAQEHELEEGIHQELEAGLHTAMGDAPVFKVSEASINFRPDGCPTPRCLHITVGTTRSHGVTLLALRHALDAIRATLEGGRLGSA